MKLFGFLKGGKEKVLSEEKQEEPVPKYADKECALCGKPEADKK